MPDATSVSDALSIQGNMVLDIKAKRGAVPANSVVASLLVRANAAISKGYFAAITDDVSGNTLLIISDLSFTVPKSVNISDTLDIKDTWQKIRISADDIGSYTLIIVEAFDGVDWFLLFEWHDEDTARPNHPFAEIGRFGIGAIELGASPEIDSGLRMHHYLAETLQGATSRLVGSVLPVDFDGSSDGIAFDLNGTTKSFVPDLGHDGLHSEVLRITNTTGIGQTAQVGSLIVNGTDTRTTTYTRNSLANASQQLQYFLRYGSSLLGTLDLYEVVVTLNDGSGFLRLTIRKWVASVPTDLLATVTLPDAYVAGNWLGVKIEQANDGIGGVDIEVFIDVGGGFNSRANVNDAASPFVNQAGTTLLGVNHADTETVDFSKFDIERLP